MLFGLSPILACSKDNSKPNLSKDEMKNLVIIDVRTLPEWNSGHLDGAKHIELDIIAQEIKNQVKDLNTPIALYCRSGRRSGIALNQIKSLGYKNAENYGGISQASQTLNKKIITK